MDHEEVESRERASERRTASESGEAAGGRGEGGGGSDHEEVESRAGEQAASEQRGGGRVRRGWITRKERFGRSRGSRTPGASGRASDIVGRSEQRAPGHRRLRLGRGRPADTTHPTKASCCCYLLGMAAVEAEGGARGRERKADSGTRWRRSERGGRRGRQGITERAERDDAARDEGERTCYHIATSTDHLTISSANP